MNCTSRLVSATCTTMPGQFAAAYCRYWCTTGSSCVRSRSFQVHLRFQWKLLVMPSTMPIAIDTFCHSEIGSSPRNSQFMQSQITT